MNELEPDLPEAQYEALMQDVRGDLRRLDRRDWWLWWTAVTVMLLLAAAVVVLSLPALLKEPDRFFQVNLETAVRGLVGLVLLFNLYTLYQQILIKRLRNQMAENMVMMARLRVRAEEFHKLATIDPLTSLPNRRLTERRLAGELSRSQRYGHPLTVLMLDLNGFKQINDRHGHAAGDDVLRMFAEHLNRVIRSSDVAGRLGGDEFMVILPECLPQQVERLLERLRPLTVDFRGETLQVTCAVGWAGYQAGETPEQIMERADQALYADKRSRGSTRALPVAG
jgi:diguanylate cyclase (GGDEF)-like protein